MFKRVYIEIQNTCNLHCSFCPKTKRPPKQMSVETFQHILSQLSGVSKYLCFHVMGEPLLHPQLETFLQMAGKQGFRVCLTTNGVILHERKDMLAQANGLHKVSISLHAMEGNGKEQELCEYLQKVWDSVLLLSQKGKLCSLRLWNLGGEEACNQEILSFLKGRSPMWEKQPNGSFQLAEKVYLEEAQKFDWPDLTAQEQEPGFCYGLRQQLAILVDGTVVPCCLDHEGDIPLGNILTTSLGEILSSPRAKALIDGFTNHKPSEELCRHCGYATRFSY